MASWWRVTELGGRYYPEYTLDNGQTWLRNYEIACIRNGYQTERGARDYCQSYISNGGSDWWEQPNTLTPDEQKALLTWTADHASGMNDDTESEEGRRIRFVRWLVEQGKLGADDRASVEEEAV